MNQQPACVAYSSDRFGGVQFIQYQEEWTHKWEKSTMLYDIQYHESLKLISERQLKTAVNIAMTTWDIEIPVKFHPANGRVADINIRFEASSDNQYFKDKPSVLAYAYFPGQGSASGQVVFNADYIWDLKGKGIKAKKAYDLGLASGYENPDNIIKTYNIFHVLIHELGHSLGLRHDASGNTEGRDVMDPYYRADVLDLSDRDIYRIRLKYGVRTFSNWTRYQRIKNWLRRRIRR